MWKMLAEQPINNGDRVCEDSITGECWEYVGSSGDQHMFRHRRHPQTKRVETFVANLSKELASN
jgi:hypothetical protein